MQKNAFTWIESWRRAGKGLVGAIFLAFLTAPSNAAAAEIYGSNNIYIGTINPSTGAANGFTFVRPYPGTAGFGLVYDTNNDVLYGANDVGVYGLSPNESFSTLISSFPNTTATNFGIALT